MAAIEITEIQADFSRKDMNCPHHVYVSRHGVLYYLLDVKYIRLEVRQSCSITKACYRPCAQRFRRSRDPGVRSDRSRVRMDRPCLRSCPKHGSQSLPLASRRRRLRARRPRQCRKRQSRDEQASNDGDSDGGRPLQPKAACLPLSPEERSEST